MKETKSVLRKSRVNVLGYRVFVRKVYGMKQIPPRKSCLWDFSENFRAALIAYILIPSNISVRIWNIFVGAAYPLSSDEINVTDQMKNYSSSQFFCPFWSNYTFLEKKLVVYICNIFQTVNLTDMSVWKMN